MEPTDRPTPTPSTCVTDPRSDWPDGHQSGYEPGQRHFTVIAAPTPGRIDPTSRRPCEPSMTVSTALGTSCWSSRKRPAFSPTLPLAQTLNSSQPHRHARENRTRPAALRVSETRVYALGRPCARWGMGVPGGTRVIQLRKGGAEIASKTALPNVHPIRNRLRQRGFAGIAELFSSTPATIFTDFARAFRADSVFGAEMPFSPGIEVRDSAADCPSIPSIGFTF